MPDVIIAMAMLFTLYALTVYVAVNRSSIRRGARRPSEPDIDCWQFAQSNGSVTCVIALRGSHSLPLELLEVRCSNRSAALELQHAICQGQVHLGSGLTPSRPSSDAAGRTLDTGAGHADFARLELTLTGARTGDSLRITWAKPGKRFNRQSVRVRIDPNIQGI